MNNTSEELQVDVRLEIGDKTVFFDQKRFFLLKYIDELGSIMKASKKAEIPYRSALKYIEDMETELKSPVVITQRGGKGGGGGSRLSDAGKSLTWEYIKLANVIRKHRVVNEISGLVSEIDKESRIIKIVLDSKKISVPLTDDLKVGDAVLILISPDDIMVMLEPQPSSLRNVFPCEIVAMELKEGTVRLTVTLDGISLMVDITEYSREKLDLNLGKEVYIGFKAASISVIKIS
ncbi:MAG: TOBE domain-containing protein [Methanobacteriaceae archaeon]|nr:TOBE domain-containing protein [Methanobacteriaceae archaeon]